MNNRKGRGIGFYVVILLVFLGMALIWTRMQDAAKAPINHEMFESYLKSDDVAGIRLIQNAEVPTGQVLLDLKSGVTVYMYTSDISAIEKELDSKYPAYTREDVKREGWFTARLNF